VDVEAFEHGLVDRPSLAGVGAPVGLVTVLGERQGRVQVDTEILVRRIESGQAVVDLGDLTSEFVLFGLEEGDRYGVGVVRFDQLVLPGLQVLSLATQLGTLDRDFLRHGVEFPLERRLEGFA
jgi:hypothetical protein